MHKASLKKSKTRFLLKLSCHEDWIHEIVRMFWKANKTILVVNFPLKSTRKRRTWLVLTELVRAVRVQIFEWHFYQQQKPETCSPVNTVKPKTKNWSSRNNGRQSAVKLNINTANQPEWRNEYVNTEPSRLGCWPRRKYIHKPQEHDAGPTTTTMMDYFDKWFKFQ